VILLAILNHRQLQGQSQLRRGKSDARGFVHAVAHRLDQLLDFAAAQFLHAERAGTLPQNGIPCLNDFKFHGIHNFRSQACGMPAILDLISIRKNIREAGK
jgi:hypothetical protein